jgi:mono/diheme cytochrome c family protein
MTRLALCATACLAAVLASAGCIDEDIFNPMAHEQPRVGAYSESEFYSDGLAMRAPPPGTVPHERVVGHAALGSGQVPGPQGPVWVTRFPVAVDHDLMDLGQKRYNIICATCHGPVGDGDSIVGRQMSLRPPPSLHLYADRPVGYFYDVIVNGFGLMASYAAELSVRERWAVVAYVRALQMSQYAPMALAPPAEQSRLMQESTAELGPAPGVTP